MHDVSITVLMPVFNGERFLQDAVHSILGQTYADFEFLIIDDASTDGTGEILASFDDPRMRVVRNPANLGVTASLNKGLGLARGTYIARMDADDVSLPHRLARQVRYLEAHPEVGVCGSWVRIIGAARDVWRYPTRPDVIRCSLLFRSAVAHPAVMFRRELFLKAGLSYDPETRKGQDYELWVRAARQTAVANIGEILLSYRLHAGQVGRQHGREQQETAGKVRLKQLHDLGLDPSPEEVDIHEAVSRYDLKPDKEFVNRTAVWFEKLRRANEAAKIYPEPAFSGVLGLDWMQVCRAAAPLGLWTLKQFINSPLRRYYFRVLRDRLIR